MLLSLAIPDCLQNLDDLSDTHTPECRSGRRNWVADLRLPSRVVPRLMLQTYRACPKASDLVLDPAMCVKGHLPLSSVQCIPI